MRTQLGDSLKTRMYIHLGPRYPHAAAMYAPPPRLYRGASLIRNRVPLQGLLEIKDTHRLQEGPMLLGIELP